MFLQLIEGWSFIFAQNNFHPRSQMYQSRLSVTIVSSVSSSAERQRVTLERVGLESSRLSISRKPRRRYGVKWYSWAARVPPWHSGAAVSRTARTSGLRLSLAAQHLHVLLARAHLLALPARLPLGDSDSEANWWLSNCPWFECEQECLHDELWGASSLWQLHPLQRSRLIMVGTSGGFTQGQGFKAGRSCL